jgi:hypothetical protein
MANVQYTENLTEEQLDAMAGSETLKYQATSFGMTRNNKVRNVKREGFGKQEIDKMSLLTDYNSTLGERDSFVDFTIHCLIYTCRVVLYLLNWLRSTCLHLVLKNLAKTYNEHHFVA